ncbi:hypothetical protein RclHR1_02310013 [Rhizophagus clarus]|uniref:Endonuclease/exonuclease/phosphatase domain-containing protein n=1 Tax=Rhizophagus clarus TaxID=94130 RepID=A0A2Z6QV99_9GLOM|nr:hypothetical protein RclHR1_02310013 [Rhizophagus clarus]
MMNLDSNDTLIIDNSSHSLHNHDQNPPTSFRKRKNFNITQKNQKNEKTIKRKKINNESEPHSTSQNDTNRRFFNPNFKNTGQFFNSFITFSNNKYETPSIGIATHNIRGNFRNKLPDIINTMINNNIHILHICETHETQAPHQESSKAHKFFTIQKITEVQHTNTNIYKQLHFHIINNPIDDGSRKAGNAIIISDLFFKHIARIHTIPGRYIYINLNFKHKHQINIFGFYLPTNSTTNRQNIYEAITEVYKQHFNKKINTRTYNFVLGDFNDNDVIFDDHDTPI